MARMTRVVVPSLTSLANRLQEVVKQFKIQGRVTDVCPNDRSMNMNYVVLARNQPSVYVASRANSRPSSPPRYGSPQRGFLCLIFDRLWHFGDICNCQHKEKRHPISEVALASFPRIHAARPGAGFSFPSDLYSVYGALPGYQTSCMGIDQISGIS